MVWLVKRRNCEYIGWSCQRRGKEDYKEDGYSEGGQAEGWWDRIVTEWWEANDPLMWPIMTHGRF